MPPEPETITAVRLRSAGQGAPPAANANQSVSAGPTSVAILSSGVSSVGGMVATPSAAAVTYSAKAPEPSPRPPSMVQTGAPTRSPAAPAPGPSAATVPPTL